jgi:ribosome-binding ATPase YchF (GTP1/OBG family)
MIIDVMTKLNLDPENVASWTEDDLMKMAVLLRKMTKPMIIAANKCDISTAAPNLKRLAEQFPEYKIIPTSAESELALREASKVGLIDYSPGEKSFNITPLGEQKLNTAQRNALEFIKNNVLSLEYGTGVQQVLNISVFDVLKYIAIFPGGLSKLEDSKGNVLPDCFLMPPDTTALAFAFRLHTDFGNNFVKAMDVRTRMPIGKDHKLKHRDILEIMANK